MHGVAQPAQSTAFLGHLLLTQTQLESAGLTQMEVNAAVGLQRGGEPRPQRHRIASPLRIGTHPVALALDPQQAKVAPRRPIGVIALVEDADLATEQGQAIGNGQPDQTTPYDHHISFLHDCTAALSTPRNHLQRRHYA
ncbi:hypothetical protein D3C87_1339120 [compost metagenome]